MMYEKTCPVCKQKSYSSIATGKWICPTKDFISGGDYGCGADITNEHAYEAEMDDLIITDREVQDA